MISVGIEFPYRSWSKGVTFILRIFLGAKSRREEDGADDYGEVGKEEEDPTVPLWCSE